jgi:hypothetical protein
VTIPHTVKSAPQRWHNLQNNDFNISLHLKNFQVLQSLAGHKHFSTWTLQIVMCMLMWLTNVRFKIDAMLNAVRICTNCIIYHMMHSKWSFVRMGHSNFWGENNVSMPTCGHLHTHPWYDIDTHSTTKENNTHCHV